MSKKTSETREKILALALEMFNEKGVEYVGLRELAALLDIRVGNITYYFPTKDDLVNQLALDLSKLNSAVLVVDKNITLGSFLEMFRKASRIQMQYSGLLLSMVHLLTHNKNMLTRHRRTQADRNQVLTENINNLIESGYLKIENKTKKEFLAHTLALIARFWISESTISFRQLNPEEQIDFYLSMIASVLSPHSTKKGLTQITEFFAS